MSNELSKKKIFGCLVVAVILTGFANWDKLVPDTPPPVAASKPVGENSLDGQKAVISKALNGLKLLATKSPRAQELLQFMLEYGAIEPTVGDNMVGVVPLPKPDGFYITGIAQDHQIKADGSYIGARFLGYPTPMMTLQGTEMSDFGAGLALAHELVHAEDRCLHHEGNDNYPDPEWLKGEMNAHRNVAVVLDEYTGGAWSAMINQRVANMEKNLLAQGGSQARVIFIVKASDEDVADVKSVLGELDNFTMGAALSQMDVESNLLHTENFAASIQAPDDEKAFVEVKVMESFYQSHQATAK